MVGWRRARERPLADLQVGDGLKLGHPQLPQQLLVLPQICLAANEHPGCPRAEMRDFRKPLWRERLGIRAGSRFVAPKAGWLGDRPHLDGDIVKAGGVHDIIADEHEVGVLVGQGPQSVIVLLP